MDGFIDHLRRPVVRIELPQAESEGLICLIDTGFNGFLLLERSKAHRFQFQLLDGISDQIVLGDGSIRLAEIARNTILWLGSPLLIDAYVVQDPRVVRYSSPEHQIDAMIGTALLDGLRVELDFRLDRVRISRDATSG